MRDLARIQGWLREHFPKHSYTYFGVSGATLLHEAFKRDRRETVILPGYICASLSESASRAGKRVLHADMDPGTMHPDTAKLDQLLASQNEAGATLLIDHAFGYPFSGLEAIRRKYPKLLIIEDCARALGARIHGHYPGAASDWILISMYKTTRGSRNGAILLTKAPIDLTPEMPVKTTIRERAAGISAARFVYDQLRRRRSDLEVATPDLSTPDWKFAYGSPGRLCMKRFESQLHILHSRTASLRRAAEDLIGDLSQIEEVQCTQIAHGCQSAGYFVSFDLMSAARRNFVLTALHRQGLFLGNTWPIVPAHYRSYADTFPFGDENTLRLADRMAHIPVEFFQSGKQRRHLLRSLRRQLDDYRHRMGPVCDEPQERVLQSAMNSSDG
jgi:dTDP-4-amino-4,6-dideoxygalactose transaminase